MRNKGFTLIELLAVIVILAIIALIAVPIILGIIDDTKEEATDRSINMYAKAVENAVATYQLKEKEVKTDLKLSDIEKYIEYDGDIVCKITNIYEDGSIYLAGCKVNKSEKEYTYGTQHLSKENVKAVTIPTTGIVPAQDESGNIIPGSEFKIKVSDISDFLTFFVLSNEGEYVNLIAEQNITPTGEFTSELQDGDEWYFTADNRYGPQKVYTYLSIATSNWTNIPIIESFNYLDEGNQNNSSFGYQSIITEFDPETQKYITTITPYSSSFGNPKTYENMRVRLPKYSEVTSSEVGCSSNSSLCPVWIKNYLGGVGNLYGYLLLSSVSNTIVNARDITRGGKVAATNANDVYHGARPVITILKSDLLRVMQ